MYAAPACSSHGGTVSYYETYVNGQTNLDICILPSEAACSVSLCLSVVSIDIVGWAELGRNK